MAQQTITLSAVKWGYVNQDAPSTHYTVTDSGSYTIDGYFASSNSKKWLYFGLSSAPSAIRRQRILGYHFAVQAYAGGSGGAMQLRPTIYPSAADFNAAAITWNSQPGAQSGALLLANTSAETGWFDFSRDLAASALDPTTDMNTAQKIAQAKAFVLTVGYGGLSFPAKTKLKNGSAALMTISYDDAVVVNSKVSATSYPSGIFDPRLPAVFQWELVKAVSNYYCLDETFVQQSATLFWRLSGESSWNSIPVSGTTQEATIPADTFPTATGVEWYIQATDTDGTTTTTDVRTFSTVTTHIAPISYPSGSNVNTQPPITFTWVLNSSLGDYDQESASLFWRIANSERWTEVPADGGEKQVVIPANTFPTSATIEWYMEGTDTGGHTSESDVYSFTTPALKIMATVYPTGKNHDPQQPISFSWVYRNSVFSDYEQRSASLFWRRNTEPNFHEIVITGNQKSASIPANTFPTSATVQWYLVGTDAGGTQSSTAVATFQTLTTQITPQDSPTGGYWDPRNETVFSWYYANPTTGDYDQQSATFFWKKTGDEDWTQVAISGNQKSLTFAANFFPVATEISWYLEGTDAGGTTSNTEVFTFSTAASTAYAYCVAPSGRVLDGTQPITFEWTVSNDDGSDPSRTVVEWKYDTGSAFDWATIVDTTGFITEYTVPGEYFEPGAVEWRVSVYNRDNVQGPKNQTAFICMMAPAAPVGLTATAVPRTKIRWQSNSQEAYEVSIDGEVVAKAYGPSVFSYQQDEPLDDGEHIISVRVQGIYGMWSDYSTTSIFVENVPAHDITLAGRFETDARLSWEYSVDIAEAVPQIYRDGVRIASAAGLLDFTDRRAIGTHSYFVELWESDGNYSRSNTITGTIEVRETVIAAAAGGPWISLKLSEKSEASNDFNWHRSYALQYVGGANWPVIETGSQDSLSGSYDCAFTRPEEAAAFEALRGKTVIIKSRQQNIVTGVLTDVTKRALVFYTSFSFSIQQIHLEDFADGASN